MKALVAWKMICSPKCYGGLNIIDVETWNKVNLIKLLLNLSKKYDSLWVICVHAYYLNNKQLMDIESKPTDTWIMKVILKRRDVVRDIEGWDEMKSKDKFNMNKVYIALQESNQQVDWKDLMYVNMARPRTCFILWLACQDKLATKDRFFRFGMINNIACCFCTNDESINHLFFECQTLRNI